MSHLMKSAVFIRNHEKSKTDSGNHRRYLSVGNVRLYPDRRLSGRSLGTDATAAGGICRMYVYRSRITVGIFHGIPLGKTFQRTS